VPVSYHDHGVLKIDDLKFFECPQSAVKPRSWHLLSLVTETTDADGNILHLPYPGTILDQPGRYREAVRIVKSERNSDWFRQKRDDWAKQQAKRD